MSQKTPVFGCPWRCIALVSICSGKGQQQTGGPEMFLSQNTAAFFPAGSYCLLMAPVTICLSVHVPQGNLARPTLSRGVFFPNHCAFSLPIWAISKPGCPPHFWQGLSLSIRSEYAGFLPHSERACTPCLECKGCFKTCVNRVLSVVGSTGKK